MNSHANNERIEELLDCSFAKWQMREVKSEGLWSARRGNRLGAYPLRGNSSVSIGRTRTLPRTTTAAVMALPSIACIAFVAKNVTHWRLS
jgi:hypothetical protein